MAPSTPPSSLLIKGFLPVRLRLPACNHFIEKLSVGNFGHGDEVKEDETFMFIKPHVANNANNNNNNNNNHNNNNNVIGNNSSDQKPTKTSSNKAIFVVNVPVVPGVRTSILLKALLGRFGDVERVTVVENPRNQASRKSLHPDATITRTLISNSYFPATAPCPCAWSTPSNYPTFLPPIFSEGKFAQVEFTSVKEMKRTMKALKEIMSEKTPQRYNSDGEGHNKGVNTSNFPSLRLERQEIQTLMYETRLQYHERHGIADSVSDDEENYDQRASKPHVEGIIALADRYRANYRRVLSSRSAMMEECNAVIEAYEAAEDSYQRERQIAAHLPDDDGFVTVTHSNAFSSQQELELSKSTAANTRRSNQRSRKKKQSMGASNLPDFYRFQRKENKKRELQDLRKKFEEDLATVKRLKEEQHYKPFG